MEWLSLRDIRPKHKQKVLIASGEIVTAAEVDLDILDGELWFDPVGCGGYDFNFFFKDSDVTHWMPLPPPPVDHAKV